MVYVLKLVPFIVFINVVESTDEFSKGVPGEVESSDISSTSVSVTPDNLMIMETHVIHHTSESVLPATEDTTLLNRDSGETHMTIDNSDNTPDTTSSVTDTNLDTTVCSSKAVTSHVVETHVEDVIEQLGTSSMNESTPAPKTENNVPVMDVTSPGR